MDVVGGLIGEGPANGDEPDVPVPGARHKEQPQYVNQVWSGGKEKQGIDWSLTYRIVKTRLKSSEWPKQIFLKS